MNLRKGPGCLIHRHWDRFLSYILLPGREPQASAHCRPPLPHRPTLLPGALSFQVRAEQTGPIFWFSVSREKKGGNSQKRTQMVKYLERSSGWFPSPACFVVRPHSSYKCMPTPARNPDLRTPERVTRQLCGLSAVLESRTDLPRLSK